MRATVVDLRYKTKQVLQALRRHETVDILYHGKVAGTIFPARPAKKKDLKKHVFFGMHKDLRKPKSVQTLMDELRGARYRAV